MTNEDGYGYQHGLRVPGNGAFNSAIEMSLRKPGSDTELICEKYNVGKPNPSIVDMIINQHNLPSDCRDKMVMIGDRPDTDLQFGINAGIDTCLVFTGVIKDFHDLK